MGLTRRIVVNLLKSYVKDIDKRSIDAHLTSGEIEIRGAELLPIPLTELFLESFPFGLEVVDGECDLIQVRLPSLLHLRSQYTQVAFKKLRVTARLHRTPSSLDALRAALAEGKTETEVGFSSE